MPSNPSFNCSKSTMRAVVPTVTVRGLAAGLDAVENHRDAEGRAFAHTAADHIDVARLEDPQLQRPSGNSTALSGNSGMRSG